MIILAQNRTGIVNFKQFKTMFACDECIYADSDVSRVKLGEYDNPEEANKVIFDIFQAISSGKPYFVMPVAKCNSLKIDDVVTLIYSVYEDATHPERYPKVNDIGVVTGVGNEIAYVKFKGCHTLNAPVPVALEHLKRIEDKKE